MARRDRRAVRTEMLELIPYAPSTTQVHTRPLVVIPYACRRLRSNHLTVLLANALGPEIRVHAMAPGLIDTPWTGDWDAIRDEVRATAPCPGRGRPKTSPKRASPSSASRTRRDRCSWSTEASASADERAERSQSRLNARLLSSTARPAETAKRPRRPWPKKAGASSLTLRRRSRQARSSRPRCPCDHHVSGRPDRSPGIRPVGSSVRARCRRRRSSTSQWLLANVHGPEIRVEAGRPTSRTVQAPRGGPRRLDQVGPDDGSCRSVRTRRVRGRVMWQWTARRMRRSSIRRRTRGRASSLGLT